MDYRKCIDGNDFCFLRVTEMKREIFEMESRNANERPEGFGKENSKKCFCRIPLVFHTEGAMIWITVNSLTVMISVCLCITEMRRKVFISRVLKGNGNGNAYFTQILSD